MWLAGTFHRYFLINTEMLSLVTFLKRMQRSLFIIPIKLRVFTACLLKHIFLYCTACRCDLSLRLILKIHQLHQFFSLHLSHFFLVTLALSNDIKTIHADSVWDVALGSKTILSFSRSVVSHSVTPCTAAHQASLSFPISRSLLRLTSIESVMPSKHLILCRPLLLSIFLSIRVFSSESTLCTRWPQYWSFRFSVSFSSEYSGLISVQIDWFDLLAIQGTLKSLLNSIFLFSSCMKRMALKLGKCMHSQVKLSKNVYFILFLFRFKEYISVRSVYTQHYCVIWIPWNNCFSFSLGKLCWVTNKPVASIWLSCFYSGREYS